MKEQNRSKGTIVLTVEGLGTGMVGAYGSSVAVTPAMDRLASRGVLLEQCFVDSADRGPSASQEILLSLWTGLHRLQRQPLASQLSTPRAATELSASESPRSIWSRIPKSDTAPTRLITDSYAVAEFAERHDWREVTLVDPTPVTTAAEESDQCAVMTLFAAAVEVLSDCPPGLVWIHSHGLRLPWDAPLSLRRAMTDPEDPDPPAEVEIPSLQVDEDTDPDLVVGWSQVAAAQVAVIDEGLSALMATVAQRGQEERWSWLLVGLGGVPLGEHGQLGWGTKQLHAEELHTPVIFLPADAWPLGFRRPELFQLPDVGVSLCQMSGLIDAEFFLDRELWGIDVLKLGAPESPTRWATAHSLAMVATDRTDWVRSPAWSAVLNRQQVHGDFYTSDAKGAVEESDLTVASDGEEGTNGVRDQLYVKPDDRWEVSEISARREDVLELHRELAVHFMQAIRQNDRGLLPELPNDLKNLLR